MRVFFMGTPDFSSASLKALYDGGFEVAGVFTQPDKPVGRKQIMTPPPVKVLALEHGTPVYQPRKLRDGTALDIIREHEPDVIAVVAYGRILPKDILDYPRLGCINIHGSLLPKYRGAAPIQWAVLNGEKETGVTSMYMAEDLDSGDMIDRRVVPVPEDCTAGELFDILAPVGASLLVDTLRAIEAGNASRTPQDDSLVTFAPPLTKDMAPIDWNNDALAVVDHVRGLDPWPVATTDIDGVTVKVFKAAAEDYSGDKGPGRIVSADRKGIVVACEGGAVRITELQAPGGKRMSAADYLRGHPIAI